MNNTILVADDSPTELKLVLSALGKKGCARVIDDCYGRMAA